MKENPDPDIVPYPGPPVLDAAWRCANELIGQRVATPSVVPGDDGEVQFVWRKNGWDVEVDVGTFHVDVWLRHRVTGEVWCGPLNEQRERLSDVLSRFVNP